MEVRDDVAPVRDAVRGVGARARVVRRERAEVPHRGERERADADDPRPPGPQREREHGDGDRRVPHPRDVLPDRRRDEVEREARSPVDDEDEAQDAGTLDSPGQRGAEDAERRCGTQLLQRERVAAAVRERAPEQELDAAGGGDHRGRNQQPRGLGPALERDPAEEQREQEERERARGEREPGEEREAPVAARLDRPEREERERHSERERERRREHDPRPDDRERPARPPPGRAPLAADDDGKRERRGRDRRHREQANPEERSERVVEDAVGDEAVAPRVPEVVPEREAVLEEDGALVGMGGEVAAGRSEPGEDGCERRCRAGREGRLPGERSRAVHGA